MAVLVVEVLRVVMTIITVTRNEMDVRTLRRKEKVLNFLLSLHLFIKCIGLSVESPRMIERSNSSHRINQEGY